MEAAAGMPKQDMPPPGGYPKVFYQRTFPKISLNWWKFAVGTTCLAAYGGYMFAYLQRHAWWLLMLHRLRDEENEAMKDVPGWKTGSWYGEPIYFTVPRGKWRCPVETELYSHSGRNEYEHGKHFKLHTDSADLPAWYDKFTPRAPWSDLI